MIGCPVLAREWIIDRWYEHAAAAAAAADVEAFFVVVAGADDPTVVKLNEVSDHVVVHVKVDEPRTVDRREWYPISRFERMVELRNILLDTARSIGPDHFWSIDSDILAHPDALCAMLDATVDYDAVGGACFLSRSGLSVSNYARWTSQNTLRREWKPGVTIRADVIMANKLLTGTVLASDARYELDDHGEDIGFSKAMRRVGLRIGWTSTVISRHVMDRHDLDLADPRLTVTAPTPRYS